MDQSNRSNEAELLAELERLNAKLTGTRDADIQVALSARIEQIRTELRSHTKSLAAAGDHNSEGNAKVEQGLIELQANLTAQAEVVLQKLSTADETSLRKELARASAQRYITEDPAVRNQLQARVAEIQSLLGIDVAKLAGGEMSAKAIPDASLPTKKRKEAPKRKTELADLQAFVAEKSALIRKTENESEIELPDSLEPPTPEQLNAAEKLVQQARVEKIRGNKSEVRNLLEQAVLAAPTSPSVLELLGDDFAERKQIGRALAYYRRASQLDLTNVTLERKVAMAALGVDPTVSLDQQIQMTKGHGLDDSAIPMASRKGALLISLFLPGLGHLVLGQTSKGCVVLGVWCLMLAWAILMGGDIAKLGSMIIGGRSQPNMIVVVPLFIMAVTYVVTLTDFRGPKDSVRMPVDHPRPPVDLPFE